MLKKNYLGLLLIFVLVLFLGLSSTTYATLSNSTKQELINNMQILQDKGLLSSNFMNNFEIADQHWGTYYIILITNEATDNVYIAQAYNGDTITNNGNDWTTNGSTVTTILCNRYKNGHNNNTDGTNSTSWGAFSGNNYTYTYAYSPHYNINTTKLVVAAGEEYGGSYITKTLPEFIPYKNFDNLTVNNITGVYGQTMYSWTEPMQLGYFSNLANNDISLSLLNYELYFVSPDNTETKMDDMLELYHVDIETDTLDITQEIRLKLGKLYKLKITYDGEIIYNIYYIILPVGTGIQSGATINYQYTSGDSVYSVQDSTIDIINEDKKNQDEIMGFLTSSDISSGEEPTLQDLSVPVVPDATEDFFTWLMNSVLNILYDNNDSTLEIPLYNTTHYIRSDIYKFNIEPLKTFIQAGWWFIVGVPVLKYIRRSIERLKGGELPATDDKSDLLGNIL